MSEQEIAIIIQSLRKAIERDKSYFVKAKVDNSFDPIRNQVDELLGKILQENKAKLEQEILKAELLAKRMGEWFESKFSDEKARNEYMTTCNELKAAKGKFRRHSYFDYLKALEILQDVRRKLSNAQKTIIHDLEYSNLKLNKCNAAFERYKKENPCKDWTLLVVVPFIYTISVIKAGITSYEWYVSRSAPSELIDALVFLYFFIGWFGVPFALFIAISSLVGGVSEYGNIKQKQKEIKREIESLRHRISVAEKSIAPLTAKG